MRTTINDFIGIPIEAIDKVIMYEFALVLARSELGITMPNFYMVETTRNNPNAGTYRLNILKILANSKSQEKWFAEDAVYIYTNNLQNLHPFEVIAHEMRHAWQKRMGIMSYDEDGVMWQGKLCKRIITNEDYVNDPAEIDAHKFAYDICERMFVPFAKEDKYVWTGTTCVLNMRNLSSLVK